LCCSSLRQPSLNQYQKRLGAESNLWMITVIIVAVTSTLLMLFVQDHDGMIKKVVQLFAHQSFNTLPIVDERTKEKNISSSIQTDRPHNFHPRANISATLRYPLCSLALFTVSTHV